MNQQSWADICDNDIDTVLLPPPIEKIENGIKTTIFFRTEDQEDGSKKYFKVTETSRIINVQKRTSKKAKTRRGIPKFGDCEGVPPGAEKGITVRSRELVEFEWENDNQDDGPEEEDVINDIFRNQRTEQDNLIKKLVPEHMRVNEKKAETRKVLPRGRGDRRRISTDIEDTPTIRISDLPRTTTFHDLLELVQGFRSSRIKLPRDPTGEHENRGFAFVAFNTHEHAERAKNAINNHPYGTNILHCEWSRNYLNYLDQNPIEKRKQQRGQRVRKFVNTNRRTKKEGVQK